MAHRLEQSGNRLAGCNSGSALAPVTVVGVSFAGSLSLLAACDPRYTPHIRALVLMGPYDNLGRVARFL